MIRPRGVNMHYEVELALVLGKRLKDLNPEDEKSALDAIESESRPNWPNSKSLMLNYAQATPSAST